MWRPAADTQLTNAQHPSAACHLLIEILSCTRRTCLAFLTRCSCALGGTSCGCRGRTAQLSQGNLAGNRMLVSWRSSLDAIGECMRTALEVCGSCPRRSWMIAVAQDAPVRHGCNSKFGSQYALNHPLVQVDDSIMSFQLEAYSVKMRSTPLPHHITRECFTPHPVKLPSSQIVFTKPYLCSKQLDMFTGITSLPVSSLRLVSRVHSGHVFCRLTP